ncbi:MAG: DUF3783 domain-containing protein [Clostridium sp.]|uniref:DUF3783 domain-containing protein n=1 Tax=Clostridium sp. TaxID=1506 RepID=UPI003D6D448F
MEIINERLILAYGLTDMEKEKLNSVLSKQGILPCKVIEKNMGELTIKEILCNIEAKESNIELPHEQLLLFHNYQDKQLYDLIDSIKEVKNPQTILAAVTPRSIKWTLRYLLQHLMEEREAYRER